MPESEAYARHFDVMATIRKRERFVEAAKAAKSAELRPTNELWWVGHNAERQFDAEHGFEWTWEASEAWIWAQLEPAYASECCPDLKDYVDKWYSDIEDLTHGQPMQPELDVLACQLRARCMASQARATESFTRWQWSWLATTFHVVVNVYVGCGYAGQGWLCRAGQVLRHWGRQWLGQLYTCHQACHTV